MKKITAVFLLVFIMIFTSACSASDISDASGYESSLAAEDAEEHIISENTEIYSEYSPESSQIKDSLLNSEQNTDEPSDLKETAGASVSMKIGETEVSVDWEKNDSVEELKELLTEQSLIIEMENYGGFEQTGSIGCEICSDDENITASPGDIMLYSSDQISVFYGSNTWDYTRLGHINDMTEEDIINLLSGEDVTVTLSLQPVI